MRADAKHLASTLLALAATVIAAQAALAVNLQLSNADIAKAVDTGTSQAKDPKHGFLVKDYVLFGVKNPLRISEGGGPVDAVIVATPYEELLYRAYLNSFERTPLKADDAQALAHTLDGTFGFRVFAHSTSVQPEDKDFLSGFGNAKLTIKGNDYPASSTTVFGPGEDFFILANGRHELRWLGSVTFMFDASKLPPRFGPMTFTFDDEQGHTHSYDEDPKDYR